LSHDAVALLAGPPDRRALTKALVAAGPDLRVRFSADGAVVELLDSEGRLFAAMQAAQRLALSAEAERLLADGIGDDLPAQPYWVEARGAELAGADTAGAVGRFVRNLVERLGGAVWEPEPRLARGDAFLDGTTDHPAVTTRTDRAVVVVQDRPLVPLSPWIVDAVAVHGREGRRLQVVTPSTSRITHALRSVLVDPTARWVVQAPDGAYFDGFSGVPLVWDEQEAFVVDRSARVEDGPHEAYRAPVGVPGSHLLVELRVEHPAGRALVLGSAAELLAERLGGSPPSLWGTSEPLPQAWDRAVVTRLCRERAPGQTMFAFTGPPESVRGEGVLPFSGIQRVVRSASGVRESVSLAVGRPAGEEPDLDVLSSLVAELAGRDVLRTMTVQRAAGRPDLTYEPRWSGFPLPVGLAVGAEGVSEIGTDRALSAPVRGVPFGPPLTPSVWYRVGDGTEPGAWERFRGLMGHLHPDGDSAGPPSEGT